MGTLQTVIRTWKPRSENEALKTGTGVCVLNLHNVKYEANFDSFRSLQYY